MLENLVRIEKREADDSGADCYVVFGTDFQVHPERFFRFELSDLEEIDGCVRLISDPKPNAYELRRNGEENWENSKINIRLYCLSPGEYIEAMKVQEDYIQEVLLGR